MELSDYLSSPYPLGRPPMMGTNGAVATSQPLAAQAGMSLLQAGGNAVDAALATAIALTVVEPTSNGIGSDAFALVWAEGAMHGLNGSGRSPHALDPSVVAAAGHDEMPDFGWLPVTVPGAVASWVSLHERFGRAPFASLFAPAIALAEQGFAVSPTVARFWKAAARTYGALEGPEFAPWSATFAPDGRTPQAGSRTRLPDHGATLRLIAESTGQAFYEGSLAAAIDGWSRSTGGYLRGEDLAAHRSQWVEPISVNYRGFDVWEIPPNGQGITALIALNLLEGFEPHASMDDAETWHRQIEAIKLAFADAHAYVADEEHTDVPTAGLLDKTYAATRRALIGENAAVPPPGQPPRGGTVYLCAADGDGMMVSFIQSNYHGFGSGVVVPGTGIALQNRGANFSLVEGHPNRLAPGKRPYHTIIPGFLSRDDKPIGPFGVMGGFMQPQGHVQVVTRTIDNLLHPQATLDAPRWRWDEGLSVAVEPRTPDHIVAELRRRGHEITIDPEPSAFGRGQIIWKLGDVLVAASETRADGQALVC